MLRQPEILLLSDLQESENYIHIASIWYSALYLHNQMFQDKQDYVNKLTSLKFTIHP